MEIQCHQCGILFDEDDRNDGAYMHDYCPACVEDADADRQQLAVIRSLPLTIRESIEEFHREGC